LLIRDLPIQKVELDPLRETADADTNNNVYPPTIQRKYFKMDLPEDPKPNPMQSDD
jgi:hypothetical protein